MSQAPATAPNTAPEATPAATPEAASSQAKPAKRGARTSPDATAKKRLDAHQGSDRYSAARGRRAPAEGGAGYAASKARMAPPKPVQRGQRVPERFNTLFNADFSGVEVLQGTQQPEARGAQAFAQGGKILVADNIDLESKEGRHILGHELGHVLQQDPSLRRGEADDAGHGGMTTPLMAEGLAERAAHQASRGERVTGPIGAAPGHTAQSRTLDGPGSVKAAEQHAGLLDADLELRVKGLHNALKAGSFEVATKALAGRSAGLDAAFQQIAGVSLDAAIRKTWGAAWTARYLNQMRKFGRPTQTGRVALAAGLVNNAGIDVNTTLTRCESCTPSEWADIRSTLWSELKPLLPKEAWERLEVFDQLMTELGRAPDEAAIDGLVALRSQLKQAQVKAIIGHRTHKEVDLDMAAIQTDVEAWVLKAGREERTAAVSPASALMQALDTAVKENKKFGAGDKQLVVDLVTPPAELDPNILANMKADPTLSDAERAEKERADAEAVSGLTRTLAREGTGPNPDAAGVVKQIEAMTADQREAYLVGFVAKNYRKEWVEGSIPATVRRDVFARAALKIEEQWTKAGLKKAQIAGLLTRFHYSDVVSTGYRALKELLADNGVSPKAALAAVAELQPKEMHQLRLDADLCWVLQDRCARDSKTWSRIEALVGIDAGLVKFRHNTSDSVADRQQEAQDDAEFSTLRWSTLIEIRLDKKDKPEAKADALRAVMQTQQAATRVEATAATPEGKKRLPKGAPSTAVEFLQTAINGMAAAYHVKLADLIGQTDFDRLQRGEAVVTTDYLMQHLPSKGGDKRTALEKMIQGASGEILLADWSNIEAFRKLSDQRKAILKASSVLQAPSQSPGAEKPVDPASEANRRKQLGVLRERLEGVRGRIRDFVFDIRTDRQQDLAQTLPARDLVHVVNLVRRRLISAAQGDPDFQAGLLDAGADFDALTLERTDSVAMLDEAAVRDSLIEPEHIQSSLGNQGTEATADLLAAHRDAKAAEQAASGRADVKAAREDGAKDVQRSQEALRERRDASDAVRLAVEQAAGKIVDGLTFSVTVGTKLLTGGAVSGWFTGVAGEGVKQAMGWAIHGPQYNLREAGYKVMIKAITQGVGDIGGTLAEVLKVPGLTSELLGALLGSVPAGELAEPIVKSQLKKLQSKFSDELLEDMLIEEKSFGEALDNKLKALGNQLAHLPREAVLSVARQMLQDGVFEQLGLDPDNADGMVKDALEKGIDHGMGKAESALTGKEKAVTELDLRSQEEAALKQAGAETEEGILNNAGRTDPADPVAILAVSGIETSNAPGPLVARILKETAGWTLGETRCRQIARAFRDRYYLEVLTGVATYDERVVLGHGFKSRNEFVEFLIANPGPHTTLLNLMVALDAWRRR